MPARSEDWCDSLPDSATGFLTQSHESLLLSRTTPERIESSNQIVSVLVAPVGGKSRPNAVLTSAFACGLTAGSVLAGAAALATFTEELPIEPNTPSLGL